ncbi:MAG: hypothetical protein ACK49X_14485, partial [Akkermansiaceae bacterium]
RPANADVCGLVGIDEIGVNLLQSLIEVDRKKRQQRTCKLEGKAFWRRAIVGYFGMAKLF